MKELLKLGVYTLLGTLLLSAPFAGLGMLSTHLVTEKTFWIQLNRPVSYPPCPYKVCG